MQKWIIAATIAVALLCAFTPATRAEEPLEYSSVFHPEDVTEGLVRDLARLFVSEADFDDPVEHAALGHTIARRARRLRRTRGWRAQTVLRMIANRALVTPRTDRQRWIHALTLDGARPVGWSTWTSAAWEGRRSGGWQAAIEEARALVRGDLPDPCAGPSELWGSRTHPVDTAALSRNIFTGVWVLVDCGLEGGPHDNLYVRWGTRAERFAAARRARRHRRHATVRFIR